MSAPELAAALARVETVLRRRPDLCVHDDTPAAARWAGGTRVVASDGGGSRVETDMPAEIGGSGDRVTPGWLFRAGFASCAATSIVMAAAREGIELTALEVSAHSRSDTRGLLGMAGADGEPVTAAPAEVRLQVRIAARGVSAERLRALSQRAIGCSPIPAAVRAALPFDVQVDVEPS